MIFSYEQCCYPIEVYFSNNNSFKETHWRFKQIFSDHYIMPDSIINWTVRQFQTEHAITHRKGSGQGAFIVRPAIHFSYFAFHGYFANVFAKHTTKYETLTIHFRISCEYRVSLMPWKNKPRNSLPAIHFSYFEDVFTKHTTKYEPFAIHFSYFMQISCFINAANK